MIDKLLVRLLYTTNNVRLSRDVRISYIVPSEHVEFVGLHLFGQ